MLSNYKKITINAALVLAAIVSSWLLVASHIKQDFNPVRFNQHPDAYAEQVLLTRMNEAGQPSDQIYTAKLTYYAATQTSLLTSPDLLMFVAGKTPWHVHANFAQSQGKTKSIQLWGDVGVEQTTADRRQKTMTVSTSALTLYPQQQIITSAQLITLVQPNSLIRAIGLYANIKQGELRLLSAIQGHYEPLPGTQR